MEVLLASQESQMNYSAGKKTLRLMGELSSIESIIQPIIDAVLGLVFPAVRKVSDSVIRTSIPEHFTVLPPLLLTSSGGSYGDF